MRRVLLLVDESHGGLAALRGLHRAGFETAVGISRGDEPAARSRAAAAVVRLPDPYAAPDAYTTAAAAAARRLRVAAVLPATESTLRALTGREAAFDDGVAIGTCPLEQLEQMTDKTALERLAAGAGLRTPPTAHLRADDPLPADVRFPVVVKPPRSVTLLDDGSLRSEVVRRMTTEDELRAALASLPRPEAWAVQTCVDGTLAAISGVAWHGRQLSACHQVSPRIWPPRNGISCFAMTVEPDPSREGAVARLLEDVGWSGIYNVQFLLRDGEAWLIDVNPRVYGSIGLAIGAGHNLPAWWTELLLGGAPAITPYRVGLAYRDEVDDVRSVARELISGRPAALAGLVPRRRTVHTLFELRDPGPTLAVLYRLRDRFAAARRRRDAAATPASAATGAAPTTNVSSPSSRDANRDL